MKFPYGMADFYGIIKEGFFFQDRTHKIPAIEEAGQQLLFIRPRRFGKSLLLSMLENYYDLNKADDFESLFGQLAIGQNPTPRHNQYFVMKWDFSLINASGDIKEIENEIHQHINDCIKVFYSEYADKLESIADINPTHAISSFQALLSAIGKTSHKLYLLIDEYDNFANDVMMSRKSHYEALLYGEGLLKTVFKAVKAAATSGELEKVFITGVSPVVMSDMTSGYNVATNIYLEDEFNDLCGFTEDEIRKILEKLSDDETQMLAALKQMKTFYNGYSFSELSPEASLYNPTLSLYFLRYFQKYRAYPANMLDENLAMDRNKLVYISKLPHGEDVLLKAVSEDTPLRIFQLAQRSGVEDMLKEVKDETFMTSLLYYFGILTMAGRGALAKLEFRIPNLVAKKLYVERLQDLYLASYEDKHGQQQVAELVFQYADLQPLIEFMEQRLFKVMSNRDYRWHNEHAVKIAFMTLLFNDTLYMMMSETEVGRRYVDLSLIVRPDMRQYGALDLLFEFKYLSLTDLSLNGEQLKEKDMAELAVLPQVAKQLQQAEKQARDYAQDLLERFGELNLHCFAVVALGLERVIWRKVEIKTQEEM